jgi:hypothetical protein
MKQKIFEKFFKDFCPNYKIVDYNLMERFKSDDGDEFVKMSSVVDITINRVSDSDETVSEMVSEMERTLGIDIIYELV